ncbi:group II intron reverse transcriptase/maturase [Streptomyces sp. PSKA30]|uniref:group II intron reverse transcriptase/maturase n=1 Tax=Streptomyces sp. PSKA30 TaxID=2874597 RepID=UPI001CD0A009|nr:group II intron reverse transcriptase/maturase [Streptomyces sp. PSKA30]MBZ9643176.1 group II intron reverse transcriptase/maturase [Streptomyces sp. PSKA30]
MPKDASPNGDATLVEPQAGSLQRVSEMQAKLHRWAADQHDRRFDDLFNLVHDPATLKVAWWRVEANRGARTAGSDGLTPARIEAEIGVSRFLDDLRSAIKAGQFRPQPVRERKIPKPGGSGKVRRLGIPTVADRVVQAALKLVLEPIFEADFEPVSYGFRPERRAHDAIAEIHHYGTNGYRWVLDADIEACFDSIEHAALMERVRIRIKDKRVLRLVKAFLKAGILTELGEVKETQSGTPQGGILSPLLANIALSVLDEHLMAPWKLGGVMSTEMRRRRRHWKGLPVWRVVRYADDFVVMTRGPKENVEALREEIGQALRPMGLRLSEAKTRVVHMEEGFDFLGFHIRWSRKRGTDKWYVYTFVADRPFKAVKAKIRAMTPRTSQQDLRDVLERINRLVRGWTRYFQHAVASRTFAHLRQFIWWRIVRMMRHRHRWAWKDVRRWLTDPTGKWKPISAGGIEMFNPAAVPIRRYRFRGERIPNPFVIAA